MHRFVLLNFLFEFLSENIALMDDDVRGSIAVGLLQLAMMFEFLKFLLKNFQTGFQLSVEKRKCFDLLGIPSEILIFSIVVVLEKINDERPQPVDCDVLLEVVDFCSVHRSPPSLGPSLVLGLSRTHRLIFDIYSVNPFEHLKLQKRQRSCQILFFHQLQNFETNDNSKRFILSKR